MAGLFPDPLQGGVAVRSTAGAVLPALATVLYGYSPPTTYTLDCTLNYYGGAACDMRFSPYAWNAMQSELLGLAAALVPTGTWHCGTVNNLAVAFATWSAALSTSAGVSTDAGNMLTNGTDGKAFLKTAKFMTSALAP